MIFKLYRCLIPIYATNLNTIEQIKYFFDGKVGVEIMKTILS